MSCVEFQICPVFYIVCHNYLLSCQLHSCCLQKPETEVCVIICFISSYHCRMDCKTVLFVLLLPETQTFWTQIRFGRRSHVKTVLAAVIISGSLHHKQSDILCEVHVKTKWHRAINDVWCLTVIFPLGSLMSVCTTRCCR